MDDFFVHGSAFEDSLANLEKIFKMCVDSNLSLSNEKCFMMMIEGIVLGHHISSSGIKVDPAKIQIIENLSEPTTQTDENLFRVCRLLSSIYCKFY